MPDGVRLLGVIESLKNERIRSYRRLRKRNFRYREGLFLVEGLQGVAEALASPHPLQCIMCTRRGEEALRPYLDMVRHRGTARYIVSDEVMATLSDTVTPQGVMAVSPLLHVSLAELCAAGAPVLLVANRVRDPGNLGNMIRTADAAGAGGMVICAESADPYNAKTVRSTAGSLFHLPMAIAGGACETMRVLREAGYGVLAADAHRGTKMWALRWPEKLALVMGNEAWGMPEEEATLADARVRIPLLGRAESLNVAAATAVLLYEAARRRGAGGGEGEEST